MKPKRPSTKRKSRPQRISKLAHAYRLQQAKELIEAYRAGTLGELLSR